ncbi:MAG TPA: RNase H family protein [Acidimicrobiales bacterium]|nr:RNase H family protein [Acidimicrobiales bacterium]
MTVVYTDGACSGNPGPGGWAWAVPGGRWVTGFAAETTNQRMEVAAALEALRALEGDVEVVSDSTYVVNCFRDRWWEGWLARGWKTTAKKPVANRDLWEPLIELYRQRHDEVSFRWVKGHSEDVMNDLVDKLAVRAAQQQAAEAGDGTPQVAVESLDARIPSGHRVVVVGARPPAIGGYDDNPIADELRRRLIEILAAKRELHSDLVVLTGLGLGAEQLAAEAAFAAEVPFVAALPYPDQERVWPPASQARYRDLLATASGTVVLQARSPASKQQAGAALTRRDAWLSRAADEAIAVWDEADPAVGKSVRRLQDAVGEDNVWILRPA